MWACARQQHTDKVTTALRTTPRYRRGKIALRRAAAIVLAALLSLVAQPAWAHGGPTSAPQAVTMDVGDLQARAVIGSVSTVPGIALMDLSLTTAANADQPVEVRAWPSDQPRPSEPESVVRLVAGDTGPYPSQVGVDRVGPWEIEISFPDAAGVVASARIPITVTLPSGDPAEPMRSMFYAGAGVIAIGGVATTVLTRRRWPRASGVALFATGPATLVALAVAVTLSVAPLKPAAPAVAAPQSSPAHVNVSVSALGSTPVAGTPSTLEFLLTDGSTGLPVDDVTPHHEALLHVAVIGESSRDFAHVHPARVSPGRYLLDYTPVESGEHVVEIELERVVAGERAASGTQVIRQSLQIGEGTSPSTDPAEANGLGSREVDDLEVTVEASGRLVAGAPVGLSVTVTENSDPVELAPWLGMNGHMMVLHRQANLFAHAHAVGPMSPVPALTGVRTDTGDPLVENLRGTPTAAPSATPPTDSTIDFAYTFPLAGQYDAWVQFRQGDRVVTVPLTLEVESP
jgi:hypothetical protein